MVWMILGYLLCGIILLGMAEEAKRIPNYSIADHLVNHLTYYLENIALPVYPAAFLMMGGGVLVTCLSWLAWPITLPLMMRKARFHGKINS